MESITKTNQLYCESFTKYQRFHTREVNIGGIPLGGSNPIRVQSMTTTDTMDTKATVEQTIRLIGTGCEYVRITAPNIKAAENLANIKKELKNRGYSVPLIADIHFTPNAAEVAARIVEKVRVNPGNYADKKKFQVLEYTDAAYAAEIERIRERFTPLVKICREYGTAMRIGTNHGSLSDRIMSRYGDTPQGMVESALEFVKVCEDLGYHDIVLSMKASNTQVMVQAYRLLVKTLMETGRNYPLHIGVTEAGDGEDGRVKSAVGMGALLEDGIGDTVRVSLTEEPEAEVPVAFSLIKRYENREGHTPIKELESIPVDPFEYSQRTTLKTENIGGENVPVVVIDLSKTAVADPFQLKETGYTYSQALDKWNLSDMACDYIYLGDKDISFEIPGSLRKIFNYGFWKNNPERTSSYPLFSKNEYLDANVKSDEINFIQVDIHDLDKEMISVLSDDKSAVLILTTNNLHGMPEQRRAFFELLQNSIQTPVIIQRAYENIDETELILRASTDLGSLLIDGLGDGIFIQARDFSNVLINRLSFGILQAARTRISKTEYIACPSCGRTLFDLQEVTALIRSRTNHLKGVKIGIMGCIVNGPGEMADADYGYVGSGIDKITLYKGREVVKRNIPASIAVDELINLIKGDGNWSERKAEEQIP